MEDDRTYLPRAFRHFAEICTGESPLYAHLSARVAEHPEILSLVGERQKGQPVANLLFAAVQYLLLGGADHPLGRYYPSVRLDRDGEAAEDHDEPEGDPFPPFADFCQAYEPQIRELVATRRVQTNEVGRCGMLLPGFTLAARHLHGRPLHLIEVGASAGLALLFDRYRYAYLEPDGATRELNPAGRAHVRVAVHGKHRPVLPVRMPVIADRVGIDVRPVDVLDEDTVRWTASLIWASQTDRIALFRAACAEARAAPPRLIAGDAFDLLPDLVAAVDSTAAVCLYHSHAIYQMKSERRRDFVALLNELGRGRSLLRVSLEWLGDDPGPRLHMVDHSGGSDRSRLLAECHHHGRWIRWVADEPRPGL